MLGWSKISGWIPEVSLHLSLPVFGKESRQLESKDVQDKRRMLEEKLRGTMKLRLVAKDYSQGASID
jgi:hypothetical protein